MSNCPAGSSLHSLRMKNALVLDWARSEGPLCLCAMSSKGELCGSGWHCLLVAGGGRVTGERSVTSTSYDHSEYDGRSYRYVPRGSASYMNCRLEFVEFARL